MPDKKDATADDAGIEERIRALDLMSTGELAAEYVIHASAIRRSSATSSWARAGRRGRFGNYSATTRSCRTSATGARTVPRRARAS